MRNLKRALSLALSTVMLLGTMMVGASASYADVDPQDKNLEAIEVVQMVGIMVGDENGNFNPDKIVNRAEMAVIVATMMDLRLGGGHPFVDVPAWADEYVAACYNAGIIVGYDETHFGATDDVTAVQASLMLSKTLGYFGYKGELGDDWKVATMKQATRLNMFDKVQTMVNAPLTRSEAAQMVLNTLKSDIVMVTEEGGVDVDAGDVSVVVKPSYEYHASVNYDFDYANRDTSLNPIVANSDNKLQLCEQLYGRELTYQQSFGGAQDAFKRPSAEWIYQTKSVVVPDQYDVAYTEAVSGSKIYKDLGRNAVADANLNVYVNGVAVTRDTDTTDSILPIAFHIASGNEAKIGGNGVYTEVYFDKVNGTADIIMTNTFASEVIDVKENDSNGYNVYLVDEATTKAFDSVKEFEIDDVVLYTKTQTDTSFENWAEVATGTTDKVHAMEVAQMASGTVTRVKDTNHFVLDGQQYAYSKMFNAGIGEGQLDASAVNFDMDVYTDVQGNAIVLRNGTYMTNTGVVIAVNNGGEWTNDWKVKLLKADNTIEVVSVDKASYELVDGDDTDKDGNTIPAGSDSYPAIVKYNYDSDNTYHFSAPEQLSATTTSKLEIANGKAMAKVNGTTNVVVNSKTAFFFHNTATDDRYAWTGIDNVPGISNDGSTQAYQYAIISDSNYAQAIFISSAHDLIDATEDVYFFYKSGNEKLVKDTELGDYYVLDAVVDGEPTSQMVNVATYNKLKDDGNNPEGNIATKVKINDKGIATDLIYMPDGMSDPIHNAQYIAGNKSVVRLSNSIVKIGGNAFAYKPETMVYEYDESLGVFSAKRLSSLAQNTYDLTAYVKDGFVMALFYVD